MQKNKLVPVCYEQVAERLALALVEYDPTNEINAGGAKAYQFNDTTLLLRVEGSELVVVGLVGDILPTALFIYHTAMQIDAIKSIRFHTQRKGMKRALESVAIPVHERGVDSDSYQILGVNCGR